MHYFNNTSLIVITVLNQIIDVLNIVMKGAVYVPSTRVKEAPFLTYLVIGGEGRKNK